MLNECYFCLSSVTAYVKDIRHCLILDAFLALLLSCFGCWTVQYFRTFLEWETRASGIVLEGLCLC